MYKGSTLSFQASSNPPKGMAKSFLRNGTFPSIVKGHKYGLKAFIALRARVYVLLHYVSPPQPRIVRSKKAILRHSVVKVIFFGQYFNM